MVFLIPKKEKYINWKLWIILKRNSSKKPLLDTSDTQITWTLVWIPKEKEENGLKRSKYIELKKMLKLLY